MITLQFSTTNQIGSRLIRSMTWSWASHCDIVLPDGNLLGALALENGGGVQIHPMRELDHYARVERFIVEDAPESIIDIALMQLGKKYDWEGIFGFLFKKRQWQSDEKWFCSELIAYAFQEAGYPLVRDFSYRITPRDLVSSVLLKPIAI